MAGVLADSGTGDVALIVLVLGLIAAGVIWLIREHAKTAPTDLTYWETLPREQRRGACNVCPCCGYDLRASPRNCPECNTINQKLIFLSPDELSHRLSESTVRLTTQVSLKPGRSDSSAGLRRRAAPRLPGDPAPPPEAVPSQRLLPM